MRDLLAGIRRMFTLPKNRNSIRDILGDRRTKELAQMGLLWLNARIIDNFAVFGRDLPMLKSALWDLLVQRLDLNKLKDAERDKVHAIVNAILDQLDTEDVNVVRDQLIEALAGLIK